MRYSFYSGEEFQLNLFTRLVNTTVFEYIRFMRVECIRACVRAHECKHPVANVLNHGLKWHFLTIRLP